jgi:hypothetical protein
MMKNVLGILLILGMTSLASAALSLSGPDQGNPGDTLAMSLDMVVGDSANGYIWVDYPAYTGTLSNPALTANVNPGAFTSIDTYYLNDAFGVFINPDTVYPTATNADGPAVTFDFTIPAGSAVGTVHVVELLDESFQATGVAKAVEVIPEPMTLSLLGLGGLLLRRRR